MEVRGSIPSPRINHTSWPAQGGGELCLLSSMSVKSPFSHPQVTVLACLLNQPKSVPTACSQDL